jgi:hypothetical protein
MAFFAVPIGLSFIVGLNMPLNMPLPWQRVEWVSTLTPSECFERLTKAGGASGAVSSPDTLTTVVSGGNTIRTSFATVPWWRGHPYFKGTVLESHGSTKIAGRLNPDPFAVGVFVLGFWIASQLLSGVGTRGVEPMRAYLAELVRTTEGVGFFGVLLLAIGVATIRSLHWPRQSAALARAIRQACETPR